VRENSCEGNHVVVPVPIVLAQVAVPFLPHGMRCVDAPRELQRWGPVLERIAADLRTQPDFVLVEMTTPEEHVIVRKAGSDLQVDVQEESGGEVHCRLPLQSASRVLGACRDGQLSAAEIAHVLGSLPSGNLMSVCEGGERVRIRLWRL
jgi:hypothetical protein